MSNIHSSLKIFDATAEWLGSEKIDSGTGQAKKPLNLKLCPVIVETLKKLYCQGIIGNQ